MYKPFLRGEREATPRNTHEPQRVKFRDGNTEAVIDARGSREKRENKKREGSGDVHAPEKRIKGVTTSNVALTGNWTILFAIEVVMALVAWSRYTTVRHSTIETSGPPQEVRHTCSGVCVPIIRAPAPPLQCVPSSMAHTGSRHATDILPYVRVKVKRGKKKVRKRHVHRASSQRATPRYEEHHDKTYVFALTHIYLDV